MIFPNAAKTFVENETNVERTVASTGNRAIYFKNCSDSVFVVGSCTTKVFIENCRDCSFVVDMRLITSVAEVWNCTNCKISFAVPVLTLQVDGCVNLQIAFPRRDLFQDLIWSKSQQISLVVEGKKLNTGTDTFIASIQDFNSDFDQVFCQIDQSGKWLQSLVQRTARGYVDLLPAIESS